MIPTTLAEVATVVGGRLTAAADAAAVVDGPVVVDSREVGPGGLFVAVPGRHADGHDFVDAALAGGAVAALVSRDVDAAAVVVDDVVDALGLLARSLLVRRRSATSLPVVAITGSAGKTTAKDLLAAVLEPLGATVATAASFNNELGLPLTVLRATADTRFLVLEMGARGPGHIRYLCDIAPPDVSVVLNVGSAHLGEFGSREAVARAKGEIVEALGASGLAVLNADDPLVAGMAGRTPARVRTFGTSSTSDVRADGVTVDATGHASFTLVVDGTAGPVVRVPVVGRHHVTNVLAAAAVAVGLGAAPEAVAEAMAGFTARSRWRMEVTDRADGVTVVNDAYNANPESSAAALDSLAQLGGGRRTWAVLGEMLELGAVAEAEHRRVGGHAALLGVDEVVAVGAGAAGVAAGAAEVPGWTGRAREVADTAAAVALLAAELHAQDVVLVKASRGSGLERVAQALLVPAREDGDS